MKTIKFFILSMSCVLAFCSCQKDAEKLCWGYWYVDANTSYVIEQGKRHYVSEMKKDDATSAMQFDTEGNVIIFQASGVKKSAKCHFDKDCFIVEGESYRIIESSPQSMIIESSNKSSDDFAHIKLDREKPDSFFESFFYKSFIGFAYYRITVPYWLRCIIFIAAIAALVLVARLIDNETFDVVIVAVGGLMVIFYFYMCGAVDGMTFSVH